MATYDYADDGRFHTRYSEVTACQTPKAALRMAKQRLGITERYESEIMRFGTTRHDMFDAEAKQTGLSPEIFKDQLGVQWEVYESEKHRATELFEGVVIHFTTDLIGIGEDTIITDDKALGVAIVDYKTATEYRVEHYKKVYQAQLQLPAYALLLRPHNIIAKEAHYLLECWNTKRTQPKGYIHISKDIKLADMAQAKRMFKNGIENLIDAEKYVRKNYDVDIPA